MSTYPIIGIQTGLGPGQQVPLRQEIDDWSETPANADQINLFFLALAKYQAMPKDQMKSYHQVAGIHGLPLVPWDENTTTETPGTQFGYCTHNSPLFPTWHRPYVALFEQRLWEIMTQEIIPQFPAADRPRWTAAADSWRLPYWDWAAKKTRPQIGRKLLADYDIPLLLKKETVTVFTSTGSATIPNPLYVFKGSMDDLETVDGIPFQDFGATSKCPPSYDTETASIWAAGVQNNAEVVKNLREASWYQNSSNPGKYKDTLGEAVYRLFSERYFSTYNAFASTRFTQGKPAPDYLSCEAIHNNLHNWVGGKNGGHMSEVPVAAFDPIFWLHHCNVDRQFAIWQALNTTAWFSQPSDQLTDPDGNWSTKPGTTITPQTPLAPFHSDAKATTYNSDAVRNWWHFGYSYPELQPWLPQFNPGGKFNQLLYQAHIKMLVKKLYSSTGPRVRHFPRYRLPSSHEDYESEDYVVNVLYEKFALKGSPFTVHILIGETAVGIVHNFSTPANLSDAGGCENCRQQEEAHVLATGQVVLTNALLEDVEDEGVPELGSLKRQDVENYLKERLHWKVTKAFGEEVPLESIPSLKVALAVGKGVHSDVKEKSSVYHDYSIVYPVTQGRRGGLGHEDTTF